jgi:hypothetical protein
MNELRDVLERLAVVEPTADAAEILDRAERRARVLRRRHTRRVIATIGAAAALVAGIVIVIVSAESSGHRNGVQVTVSPTSTTPKTAAGPRYAIDATVLQSRTHGPQLCTSMATSLPPQCGGTPIPDWDWTTVAAKQSINGTTWGEYHLVGTYNGKTFRLTEPPTAPRPPKPQPLPDYTAPCPAPPGGWTIVDPKRVTFDDYQAFTSTAQNQPDSAGMWVDNTTPVDGRVQPQPLGVMTVAFTGHLDEHRTQLRAIWGGPFCVVQRAHSTAELQTISQALIGDEGRHLGLHIDSVSTDPVQDRVELDVLVASPAAQQALDRNYGPGVVHMNQAMIPIP